MYFAPLNAMLFAEILDEAGMPAGPPLPAPGAGPPPPPPGAVVNWAHVAPLFARRCARCHTDDGQMGAPPEGLRLQYESWTIPLPVMLSVVFAVLGAIVALQLSGLPLNAYAQVLASRERVRVVPGNPDASAVLRRVRGQESPRMPFDGPPWLGVAEVELIERWIADGARDAAGQPAPLPVGARLRLEGRLSARWALDGLPLRRPGAGARSHRVGRRPRGRAPAPALAGWRRRRRPPVPPTASCRPRRSSPSTASAAAASAG